MNTYTKTELENKLDHCVRYSLAALLQAYPASEEFLQIFQEKLFVKSNTKAFILVAHYLFTVLDEKEFRKRFYWPIQCKQDENHFRTSTVEYINHLIEKGRLKIEKIKATHVVMSGGIKFMKFLLKIIQMVLKEVKARKEHVKSDISVPVREYVSELAEKSMLLSSIGLEIKQIITSDIAEIKRKSEVLDEVFRKIIETNIESINYEEFFNTWAIKNINRFDIIKRQQQDLQKCILDFERMNKKVIRLLEPRDFTKPDYDVETAKNAMDAIKDYVGSQIEDGVEVTNINGRINCELAIRLIYLFIEHAISLMIQHPVRSTDDINEEAEVMNNLHTKTKKLSDEMDELMRRCPGDFNQTASPSSIRDDELMNDYMATPPMKVFLKELEDVNVTHQLLRKPGSPPQHNFSQTKLLSMSKLQMQFSPKFNKSVMSTSIGSKTKFSVPSYGKRSALVSSNALFGTLSKPSQNNLSISSRIESYSMIMPNSDNLLSSTALDNSIRSNMTIHYVDDQKDNQRKLSLTDGLSPLVTETFDSSSLSSPLQQTQILNMMTTKSASKTPKRTISLMQKTLFNSNPHTPSSSTEIRIQVNDTDITSSVQIKPINKLSPANSLESVSKTNASSQDSSTSTLTPNLTSNTSDNKTPESTGANDLLSKFNWMSIEEANNKENILEISDPSLLNDSL